MTTQPLTFASVDEAIAEAERARLGGETDRAVAIYKRLTIDFPKKKRAYTAAADGLMNCGRWGECIIFLNSALITMPRNPLFLLRIASAYAKMQDFKKAADYLRRNAENQPKNPENWIDLGSMEAAADEWALSKRAFTQALSIDPLNDRAILGLGDALHQLKRTKESIALYRRALLVKPADSNIQFKLGSALMYLNQLDEAEPLLQRVIAVDAKNVAATINLGLIFYRRGNFTEAALYCRQAVTQDPKFAPAHFALATVLLASGDAENAASAFRTALTLGGDSIPALMELARAEAQAGRISEAENALQQIARMSPKGIEAGHLLTALHGGAVSGVPTGYIKKLFGRAAAHYDLYFTNVLAYAVPQHIAAILSDASIKIGPRYLDLGCGTGLGAAALASAFPLGPKVGVDASLKMLIEARFKNLYDEFIQGDVLEVLAQRPEIYDLITAIDLLPYMGDLAPLMPLVAQRLAPGGLFAYSIESLATGRYKLMRSGRFAHTHAYMEGLAREAGLTPLTHRAVVLRKDCGQPVAGIVGILQK